MGFIKILNNCTNAINWVSIENAVFDVTDQIDAWRINISSNLLFLKKCMLIVNKGEIERANRYYQVKDRNRFLISRGALRTILGKYLNISPSSVSFGLSPDKKPYIINTGKAKLHYNLSHSGDWILIAVSGSDTGADIELVKPSFQYHDILTDYFSTDEINFINEQSSLERFFLLWTRKEALVKATGKGLDGDLKLIPSLDGTHIAEEVSPARNWFVSSFKLNEQYIAALAGNIKVNNVLFMDFNFSPS